MRSPDQGSTFRNADEKFRQIPVPYNGMTKFSFSSFTPRLKPSPDTELSDDNTFIFNPLNLGAA